MALPSYATATQAALPRKKKRKGLSLFLTVPSSLLVAVIVFALISPVPATLVIRFAFRNSMAVAPDHYEEMEERVSVVKNLRYGPDDRNNAADLYIPKDQPGPFSVVLWVHGGAFVGGNKEDIAIYATALAAEGIAVVCINYQRAPEAQYPAPIMQTQEAYLWLKELSSTYSLDMTRFALAGDSAGAHIAAQFAAVQSNATYAEEMGFDQTIPLDTLRGILLFCGPFDVAKMNEVGNPIMNFFTKRIAWAYFGERNWFTRFAYQATITNHITGDFPPTFISDSNTLSFEAHGRALAEALRENGVFVETYFIPIDTEVTAHEYQFIMNTPAGQESFRKMLDFLKRVNGTCSEWNSCE